VVEDAGDEHQATHQIGALQRNEQRHNGSVTAADQMSVPADDGSQERDRVLYHQVERDRAGHVRRVAVGASLGCVDAETLCKRVQVRSEGTRADACSPGVEKQ
jgi:hypothetical protein